LPVLSVVVLAKDMKKEKIQLCRNRYGSCSRCPGSL